MDLGAEDASLREHDGQQDTDIRDLTRVTADSRFPILKNTMHVTGQQYDIESLIRRQVYGPEATLRKLPLWGADEWNFEWPTPEAFLEMGLDVSVDSILFKSDAQTFLTYV